MFRPHSERRPLCRQSERFPLRVGLALREVVVIGAMAIFLLMLLVMWIASTRGDSRRNHCSLRQQQSAVALLQYDAMHGHFPGYCNLQAKAADGRPQPTSWVFVVLPYLAVRPAGDAEPEVDYRAMAEDPLLDRPYAWIHRRYGPEGPDASRGTTPREPIAELVCPDDPAFAKGEIGNALSWVVNTGMPDAADFGPLPADWNANGIFVNQFDDGAAGRPLVSTDFLLEHDGMASTLLLSENADAGQWTNTAEALLGFVWVAKLVDGQPARGDSLLPINAAHGEGDGTMRFARPSAYHVGGVNAVYADGQTQFVSENIDWLVFTRLMTSHGAEAKLPGTREPVPAVYR